MAVPASTDELESFTPASLRNLPVPPVFLLRPADGRELRRFEYRLMAEGLQFHNQESFRAEMLRGLEANYSAEGSAHGKALLEGYWALLDQGGKPDEATVAAANELTPRILRAWPPLARMAADNKRFNDESGRIAASMFVVGWTGLDVAYSREDGAVPLARIDEVEEKLAEMEAEAAGNGVEGIGKTGTAWIELSTAAYKKLVLTRDEEKNLSSPPPSKPGPNGSTKRRSKRTGAAKSKASASSESPPA